MEFDRKSLGKFVSSLFNPGDIPNQPCALLAPIKGGAKIKDLINFSIKQEVLLATTMYLATIEDLWVRSNSCTPTCVKPFVMPGLEGEQPLTIPLQTKCDLSSQRLEDPMDALPKALQQTQTQVESQDQNQPASQPQAIAQQPLTQTQPADRSAPSSRHQPQIQSSALKPVIQPSGSSAINHTARPGKLPPSGRSPGKPVEQRAYFHLPNAKVGEPYFGVIEGKDPTGKSVIIMEAQVHEGLGLSFDLETSQLRGTPLLSGDHKVSINWTEDDKVAHTSECLLIVNPDPRSLWKKIAPPSDDPYFKSDTDGIEIRASSHSIVAARRRGRSHEHSGTFCDDDFFLAHDTKSDWSILIVADGAGSAKNSRWGSKLAVKAFGDHVLSELADALGGRMTDALAAWSSDFESTQKLIGSEFHYLFHKAGTLAVQAIEAEAQVKGVAPKEYATTLLAAVAKQDGDELFLATFWMGDGAIAAYGPRGKVRLMGTPDSGEFAGQTRFLDKSALSDSGYAKRVKIGRYPDLTAIILMTDGVSDPKFETDNGMADALRWDALWDEIGPLVKSPSPDKNLTDWLEFFSPGHHDDRTIAILF